MIHLSFFILVIILLSSTNCFTQVAKTISIFFQFVAINQSDFVFTSRLKIDSVMANLIKITQCVNRYF